MTPNILKANGLIAVHFTGDNYNEIKEYLDVFDCEFIDGSASYREIYIEKIKLSFPRGCWFVYSESIPFDLGRVYSDDEPRFLNEILPALLNQHSRKSNESQIIESENIIKREDGSIAFQFTGHNYDEIKPLFDLARVRCECVLPEGSNFPKLFCFVRNVKTNEEISYQVMPGGWMVYNPKWIIGIQYPTYYKDFADSASLEKFIECL